MSNIIYSAGEKFLPDGGAVPKEMIVYETREGVSSLQQLSLQREQCCWRCSNK
jgi:hypothetical protein